MFKSSQDVPCVFGKDSEEEFFLFGVLEQQVGMVFHQLRNQSSIVQLPLHNGRVSLKHLLVSSVSVNSRLRRV